jgi:uncharacterized protein
MRSVTGTRRPELFLDANILFSAAWKDDAAALLLFELAAGGFCTLVTSRLAREEASSNLTIKRPERLVVLKKLMASLDLATEPGERYLEKASRHGLPDKDIPILAAALSSSASLLVTGDRRDFGHLYGNRIEGVEVVGLGTAIERVIGTKQRSSQDSKLKKH